MSRWASTNRPSRYQHHIAEHRETPPLAYLELLRLYHTLSRVDEFAQLRTQFMQFFNAQVPEFAGFHRTGRMLYHYTDALAEIEAEWTTPAVLGLLEKFLFRRSGAEAVEPFDLAAYDDLLLLWRWRRPRLPVHGCAAALQADDPACTSPV